MRNVLLVLAVAVFGFTLITMPGMDLGSGQAPVTQTMAAATHAVTVHTPAEASLVADRGAGGVPTCASECAGGGHGGGRVTTVLCLCLCLCLFLLPAVVLATLRLLRGRSPSALELDAVVRRRIRSAMGYRGPPRPRPTLAALCVLRT